MRSRMPRTFGGLATQQFALLSLGASRRKKPCEPTFYYGTPCRWPIQCPFHSSRMLLIHAPPPHSHKLPGFPVFSDLKAMSKSPRRATASTWPSLPTTSSQRGTPILGPSASFDPGRRHRRRDRRLSPYLVANAPAVARQACAPLPEIGRLMQSPGTIPSRSGSAPRYRKSTAPAPNARRRLAATAS